MSILVGDATNNSNSILAREHWCVMAQNRFLDMFAFFQIVFTSIYISKSLSTRTGRRFIGHKEHFAITQNQTLHLVFS